MYDDAASSRKNKPINKKHLEIFPSQHFLLVVSPKGCINNATLVIPNFLHVISSEAEENYETHLELMFGVSPSFSHPPSPEESAPALRTTAQGWSLLLLLTSPPPCPTHILGLI